MAVGLAAATANAILDALCRSVAWSEPAALFAKLHLGDPGAAGTSNPAAETDRVQVTFSAAASGAITNSAIIEWLAVAATETYTHLSFWDASSGGNFICSCALTSSEPVTAGDDFEIPVGDLDLNLTPLAA